MAFPIPNLPNAIPLIDIELLTVSSDNYNSQSGLYEDTAGTPVTFKGALLPVTDTLEYSEGTYSSEDKKLYTERTLFENDEIRVNNKIYTVDRENDYVGLTQTSFRRYFVKRVGDTQR